MKIYYAHCMAIYNTPQEKRDMETIARLFPDADITNPNNPVIDAEYKQSSYASGMDYFTDLVKVHDMVVFRALPNGMIPAGVAIEIDTAIERDIPVIELPCYTGRIMSLDDTRRFLREIGQR